MARVFVTGSADGLGLAVGQRLIEQGHEVVLHARSDARAADTREAAPGAADVLVGDLADEQQVRGLAAAANDSGRFDAVIHNAGVGGGAGGEALLAVNVVAPYLLTALMTDPDRLVYLSSGSHHGGKADVGPVEGRGSLSYSDSKLLDAALSAAVARRKPDVLVNAVDPGWIATRMGGSSAPGDLDQGSATQIWLATSDDPAATVTGRYFKDSAEARTEPAVTDEAFQDELLAALERRTGETI
ncbi:SDR family NAD(P)-dependent oxidoreductase [Amnibacterium endophyticum]|uniref:SDR family NAD(P)-dependent oxidoreductase n=1 Tax=Amnibacterium endophyticum TaxID=2109337 RepID=A0ABW4LIK8_9MICO